MYLAKLSRCSFLAEISVNTNGFPSDSEYYLAAVVNVSNKSFESSALNKTAAIFFDENTSLIVLSSKGTTSGLWFLVIQFLSPSSTVSYVKRPSKSLTISTDPSVFPKSVPQ